MKYALIALIVLAGVASAGSWIEGTMADTVSANVFVANAVSWTGAAMDSCRINDYWHRTHDTAREYVTGFDTTLVIKRIICDTTLKQIDVDSLGFAEFKAKVACDTVYTRRIDTLWADKLTVRLTPDQLSRLLNLIE